MIKLLILAKCFIVILAVSIAAGFALYFTAIFLSHSNDIGNTKGKPEDFNTEIKVTHKQNGLYNLPDYWKYDTNEAPSKPTDGPK